MWVWLRNWRNRVPIIIDPNSIQRCTRFARNYAAYKFSVKSFQSSIVVVTDKARKTLVQGDISARENQKITISISPLSSEKMERRSIILKSCLRNFLAAVIGTGSLHPVIDLIKSFSFDCKSYTNRIAAFPQYSAMPLATVDIASNHPVKRNKS